MRSLRTIEDATAALGKLGEHRRALARLAADLADEIHQARERHRARAAPLEQAAAALERSLAAWALEHRDELTRGGKTQSVELATGWLGWRRRPPSVRLRSVPRVIAAIRRLGLTQFIRVEESVNKEALLADPETAARIPGVTIESAGEVFWVEPREEAEMGSERAARSGT